MSGALHTLYLQKHGGVPKIPADADELANFKDKAIVDLGCLKTRLHENLHDIAQRVIDKIKSSDTEFSNFIQFGSFGNKTAKKQALKQQVKDSCVLPLNEAVVVPDDTAIQTVYKIADIFNDTVTIDRQGPIYTYLFGLKKEVDVDNFTSFVRRVNEQLEIRGAIESKDYLELFKGREEE